MYLIYTQINGKKRIINFFYDLDECLKCAENLRNLNPNKSLKIGNFKNIELNTISELKDYVNNNNQSIIFVVDVLIFIQINFENNTYENVENSFDLKNSIQYDDNYIWFNDICGGGRGIKDFNILEYVEDVKEDEFYQFNEQFVKVSYLDESYSLIWFNSEKIEYSIITSLVVGERYIKISREKFEENFEKVKAKFKI